MKTKLKKKKTGEQARNIDTCLYGQSGVLATHLSSVTTGQLFVLQWQRSELLLVRRTFLGTLSARRLYTLIFRGFPQSFHKQYRDHT